MTLIVGIKCKDGIVLAADSAATMGIPLGPSTVVQKCTKLTPIGDLVIGTSGPVGLGQLFVEEIDKLLKSQQYRSKWKTSLEAKTNLQSIMWQHAKKEWETTDAMAKTIGQQAAHLAMSSTVIALHVGDTPQLIQFDCRCSPEAATDALPFIAIGSGQPQADPFLAFIRNVLWPTDLPKLEHGIFYAVWAVSEAIRIAPSGLAKPIQVVTLSNNASSWTTHTLSEEDLGEHQQAIQDIQDAMREACEKRWTTCSDMTCPSPPMPNP